ncbi:unnamed protein product [Ixodes persulcatus]
MIQRVKEMTHDAVQFLLVRVHYKCFCVPPAQAVFPARCRYSGSPKLKPCLVSKLEEERDRRENAARLK